ncbi:MAG: hypothetical protein PHC29_04735 [Candidatus Omnitrophica bacterium]|nr:hypothetical protein [Candidatus Omnitrophota bacterium]
MGKVVVFILMLVLSSTAASLAGSSSFVLDNGPQNTPPEPRLKYPINDTVILSGNEPLEFGWWNDFEQTNGYIFKIYKGYNMYASNLVFKKDLPFSASSIKVKSGLFDANQVYTWSLVRIGFGGYKSDKSFNSFKVIKK